MNFYAFHIGDYASATQHLTDLEDLAYRRMIDVYYVSERPLPLDRRQLYRVLRANSEAMRDAVDVVISEFFTEGPDGWRHKRCDAEIDKFKAKSEKAKANGKLGGQAKAKRSPSDEVANATDEPSKGLAPNPNPNKDRGEETRARDPDAELEQKLREAAGWQSHPAPKLAITGEIQALIDSGADLHLDVLPIIKLKAPKCRHPHWGFFIEDIAEARDRRIEAATIVSPPSDNRRPTHAARQQKPSRAQTLDAIRKRIDQIEAGRTISGAVALGDGGLGDPTEGPA